jgi:hypothetical protein
MYLRKLLTHPTTKFSFYNTFKYNFSRVIFQSPIYPGDKVLVLPPWKKEKLNNYASKLMRIHNKKLLIPVYGFVKKMYRRKRLARVSGVNKVLKFTSPFNENFFKALEQEKSNKIKKRVEFKPVSLDRLRLVDPKTNKRIRVKFITDESGKRKRINIETNEEFPYKLKFRTYVERHKNRKDGPKDTSDELRMKKTYKGENFALIVKNFIKKIKHKEEIESNLILKD